MKEVSLAIDQNKYLSQYIYNKGPSIITKNEDSSISSSIQINNKKSQNEYTGGIKFLSNFWNNLISKPDSFSQNISTEISKILEEEKGVSCSKMINSVLSQKLKLEMNSEALLEAEEKSNKIFHEDFPGDFILEYNGERLGMLLLDICFDSQNKANIDYKFKPEIKSFKGLF